MPCVDRCRADHHLRGWLRGQLDGDAGHAGHGGLQCGDDGQRHGLVHHHDRRVTNRAGQTNASCAGSPAAFTNAAANITGTTNVTNGVTGQCVVVNTVAPS